MYPELQKPIYTLDSNVIIHMSRNYPRDIFVTVWEKFDRFVLTGNVISHIEVLNEIKNGFDKEDYCNEWAKENKNIFSSYNFDKEGEFIAEISESHTDFINKVRDKSIYADPWLLAQAKTQKLIILTNETKLKNVAKEFGVDCMHVLDLMKLQKWSF